MTFFVDEVTLVLITQRPSDTQTLSAATRVCDGEDAACHERRLIESTTALHLRDFFLAFRKWLERKKKNKGKERKKSISQAQYKTRVHIRCLAGDEPTETENQGEKSLLIFGANTRRS